jgi:hypothetical protein
MARAPVTAEIEELPEADRLESFPHPRHTKVLFGQEDAERTLAAALASRGSARRRSPTGSRAPRLRRLRSATRLGKASRWERTRSPAAKFGRYRIPGCCSSAVRTM